MKKYSIFHTPVMWFFSPSFYRDVGRNWKGICAWYLLLLMILACIPTAIVANRACSKFLQTEGKAVIDQVPPISFKDGEVSTPVKQPYVITEPETGKRLVVIDTTGEVTSLAEADAPMLVTKTKIIHRQSEHETRTQDLSQFQGEFEFDKEDVTRWAKTIDKYLAYALYPVILIGSYIGRLVQILFYGLVGLIFSAMFRARLKYSGLVRLSAVAVTPVIIADAVLELLPDVHTGSGWTWGGILIAMILLIFGVAVNRGGPAQVEAATLPPVVPPGQVRIQPPPGRADIPPGPPNVPPTQ